MKPNFVHYHFITFQSYIPNFLVKTSLFFFTGSWTFCVRWGVERSQKVSCFSRTIIQRIHQWLQWLQLFQEVRCGYRSVEYGGCGNSWKQKSWMGAMATTDEWAGIIVLVKQNTFRHPCTPHLIQKVQEPIK